MGPHLRHPLELTVKRRVTGEARVMVHLEQPRLKRERTASRAADLSGRPKESAHDESNRGSQWALIGSPRASAMWGEVGRAPSVGCLL